MRASRTAGMIAACIGTVVLGMASLAWACTPQAGLQLGASTVAPGGTVDVVGSSFFANTAVVIHLQNQAGEDVVAPQSSPGPNPTARFAVPGDLSPGVYHVYAVTVDTETNKTWARTQAVQVTAPSQSGSGTGAVPTQDGASSGSTSGRTGGSATSAGIDQTNPEALSPEAATASEVQAPSTPQALSTPAAASASAPAAQRPRAAANGGGTASARPATPGVAVPGNVEAPPTPAGAEASAATEVATPSPRTVAADLWSGFAQSSAYGPSLEDAAAPARPSSDFTMAIGLLAVSIPVLLGVLGFALTGRRRSLARTGADQQD